MKYTSTRSSQNIESAQAITQGISEDGGLFVPQEFPRLSAERLERMKAMTYKDRAVEVLSMYLTDFSEIYDCETAYNAAFRFMPREECALGVAEGRVRDIAILTRVGRQVCCRVTGFDGERPLLSRRAVQQRVQEEFISRLCPGDVIDCVVTRTAAFGAFGPNIRDGNMDTHFLAFLVEQRQFRRRIGRKCIDSDN